MTHVLHDHEPYLDLLERAIRVGIRAAERDYAQDAPRLAGSIAGFEACRKKDPDELAELLSKARQQTTGAYHQDPENRLWARAYEAEVEWICNVVSCLLLNSGMPTIIHPTARGMLTMEALFEEGES